MQLISSVGISTIFKSEISNNFINNDGIDYHDSF
jgi:hypothetical protein